MCIQAANSFMASPWPGVDINYNLASPEGTGRRSRKRAGASGSRAGYPSGAANPDTKGRYTLPLQQKSEQVIDSKRLTWPPPTPKTHQCALVRVPRGPVLPRDSLQSLV